MVEYLEDIKYSGLSEYRRYKVEKDSYNKMISDIRNKILKISNEEFKLKLSLYYNYLIKRGNKDFNFDDLKNEIVIKNEQVEKYNYDLNNLLFSVKIINTRIDELKNFIYELDNYINKIRRLKHFYNRYNFGYNFIDKVEIEAENFVRINESKIKGK